MSGAGGGWRVARALVAALAVLWLIGLLCLAVAILVPHVFGSLTPVAVLAAHPAYALLLALIGLALGLLAVRLGARSGGRVVVAGTVIAAGCMLFPTARLWRVAATHGVALSPRENLAMEWNTGQPDPARSVVYTVAGGEELRLDVWLSADRRAAPGPAVVWVHGGSWSGGARGSTPLWNRWLAARGYAVFDIDYRLAPPPRWDQAVGDVKCAVGWVKAHAAEYGIDPGAILLAGGSAGGNLALAGAYLANDAALPPSCPVGDTSVAAVLAIHPVTDAVAWWGSDIAEGRRATENYTGGPPGAYPDRYLAISPLRQVRPGLPPTLIAHGTTDQIVPYAQSEALDAALAGADVPHTLVTLPGTGHSYDILWNSFATQLTRGALARFLDTYLPVRVDRR